LKKEITLLSKNIILLTIFNFKIKNLLMIINNTIFKIFLLISLLLISNAYGNCNKAKNSKSIVVAGGSITEIIYFLNLQNKLAGVDVTSNYPLEAKKLPSIGYIRNLSIEGLLSLKPNLILTEESIGPPIIKKQLMKTSVEFRIIKNNYTIDGINQKILCVSKILDITINNNIDYKKFLNDVKILKSLVKNNFKEKRNILLILMMKGSSPIIAGKNTSGHGFIKMIGQNNSMDKVYGWKPISAEEILLANPDHIIITKRALKNFSSIEKFLNLPGISSTKAAKNKNIFIKDGMSLLGYGPRTLNIAKEILINIKD
tara:strand:+ start:167 stop:1111 length:945 start_codon:yes stop_codon:yes gene_type:complete